MKTKIICSALVATLLVLSACGSPAAESEDAMNVPDGGIAEIVEFYNTHVNEVKAAEQVTIQMHDVRDMDIEVPALLRSRIPDDANDLMNRNETIAETWNWLAARRCEKFVNPRVVEAYAQAFARYIQCEEAISAYGFLGKHPTTGGAIQSPFVQMSQSFQKQANLLWYEIFEIVKQNCTTAFVGNPQDDMMEALLAGKK